MDSDNIDDVHVFFGNGTVYVAAGNQVATYKKCDFRAENLRDDAHGDYWVTDDVIVALGRDVSRKRAAEILRSVIKRIKVEMKKNRFKRAVS
jgi:hypothetical protein